MDYLEDSKVCEECPVRLFNTKHHNLRGVGNPYFGKCIVVPNVDYVAYKKGDMGFSKQVEIIKECLPSTGGLDNVYIVPLIRCNENIACEINDDIYRRCLTHFAEDIKQYDFHHIMLLGEAGRRFTSVDISTYIDTVMVSCNGRSYCVNYSPLIKYVDDSKFEVFKEHLVKWYNSAVNYNYKDYEYLEL